MSAKKRMKKWFNIGIKDENVLQDKTLPEYYAFLTADNLELLDGYCYAGMNEHLMKPFDVDKLEKAIQKAMSQNVKQIY